MENIEVPTNLTIHNMMLCLVKKEISSYPKPNSLKECSQNPRKIGHYNMSVKLMSTSLGQKKMASLNYLELSKLV